MAFLPSVCGGTSAWSRASPPTRSAIRGGSHASGNPLRSRIVNTDPRPLLLPSYALQRSPLDAVLVEVLLLLLVRQRTNRAGQVSSKLRRFLYGEQDGLRMQRRPGSGDLA